MARLFYFSFDRYGRKKTINLLREVCTLVKKTVQQIADSRTQLADLTRVSVDLHKARTLFEEMEREHHEGHSADPSDSPVPFEAVVNSAAEPAIVKAAAYNTRLSTTKASFASGHAFINGKHFDFTEVSSTASTSSFILTRCAVLRTSCAICKVKQRLRLSSSWSKYVTRTHILHACVPLANFDPLALWRSFGR